MLTQDFLLKSIKLRYFYDWDADLDIFRQIYRKRERVLRSLLSNQNISISRGNGLIPFIFRNKSCLKKKLIQQWKTFKTKLVKFLEHSVFKSTWLNLILPVSDSLYGWVKYFRSTDDINDIPHVRVGATGVVTLISEDVSRCRSAFRSSDCINDLIRMSD